MKLKKFVSNISIVALVLLLLKCNSIFEDDKTTISVVEVFDEGKLTLTADTQVAYPDSLITIKMLCLPLYSGVGRVILQVISGDSVFVETPVKDTIGVKPPGIVDGQVEFLTEFTAIERFEQDWKVMFKENEVGYAFDGYVYLDSIRVSMDSLVHVESKQARELIPPKSKFRNWASSERFLFLSPPSKL